MNSSCSGFSAKGVWVSGFVFFGKKAAIFSRVSESSLGSLDVVRVCWDSRVSYCTRDLTSVMMAVGILLRLVD